MDKEIILYSQSAYSPYVALARDLLQRYDVPFREINVDTNPLALRQLIEWTGGKHVPTLTLFQPNSETLSEQPSPIPKDASVRGLDRGGMITAPTNQQLEDWLFKYGFRSKPYRR